MSKNWHPPYSEEFKARMVELVRSGRTPAELAEESEHCGTSDSTNFVGEAASIVKLASSRLPRHEEGRRR